MAKNSSPSHKTRRHKPLAADHGRWLARAEAVALQPVSRGGSPHPAIKVGAVLVDRHGREIAAAANRFAHGVDRRRPERYKDGAKSLWINCAEQIVIAEALRKRADIAKARLYVSLEPCAVCAGLIAELRLAHVFVPVGALRRYAKLKPKWKNSIEIGIVKLAEAGVTLTTVDSQPARKKPGKRKP